MNKKKETGHALTILKILYDSGTCRTEDLAEKVGLSEKTIRNRIHSVNGFLQEHDMGSIEMRPHVGVVLYQDGKQRKLLSSYLRSHLSSDVLSESNRLSHALRLILRSAKESHPITTQMIAEQLYLSFPTAQKIVVDCEEWLKAFHIHLHSVRRKGLMVEYTEENYRQAMRVYISTMNPDKDPKDDLEYFLPGLNILAVDKILREIEKEWKFNFTDVSYSDILVYICIASYENLQGQKCIAKKYADTKDELEQTTEYRFSQALYQRLNERLGLAEQPEETLFLTIQILCSKVIERHSSNPQKMVKEYDQKLNDFVEKTIAVVSDVMNVDLTKDESLFRGLMNHIRPLLFRLRYGMPSDDSANVYVREKYLSTLRVSWLVSTLFEEYFHMSISDNELSYIALYIQSALERGGKRFKAVLVSNVNMSINQLVTDKLMHHVSDIEKCNILSVHEFEQTGAKDADIILTATALDAKDSRIVLLPDLFADSNYDLIREKLDSMKKDTSGAPLRFDSVCHSLFEPELIMTNVHYTDKNELLKAMCDKLTQKGYAGKNYYQSVLDREEASTTSIGLGVAIPHGQMIHTNESKLVVATLDKPINWGSEEVRVVFLLNILMKNEKEIAKWQAFYRQFIALTDNEEGIQKMCSFKDVIALYYYFVQ